MGLKEFRDPAREFVESSDVEFPLDRDGLVRAVHCYIHFLRASAQLDGVPVDVASIYDEFGIETATIGGEALSDIDGLAAGSVGLVFVNDDAPITRQRFTAAHELIEFLVTALRGNRCTQHVLKYLEGSNKEDLCNWGASILLMPRQAFSARLANLGTSLRSGSILAREFGTSLLATLRRVVECSERQDVALVVWHMASRLHDLKKQAGPGQTALFEVGYRAAAPKQLRVWWTALPAHAKKLDKPMWNKSVPESSLLAQAYTTRENRSGHERVDLVQLQGMCFIEAVPASIGDERCVISLLTLPDAYLPGRSQRQLL